MLDRDIIIGSVNGSYRRLREFDPSSELLAYMILLPGSDEPLWDNDRRAEFFEKFSDGVAPQNRVPTGVLHNYWTALQGAIQIAEEKCLKQDIHRVGGEVDATLAYQTVPLESRVKCAHPAE